MKYESTRSWKAFFVANAGFSLKTYCFFLKIWEYLKELNNKLHNKLHNKLNDSFQCIEGKKIPLIEVLIINQSSLPPTDLKNRTKSSIYCWETEANGGHIGVTTWGVQWRYREENENSDIFYLKLTNEICWLDTN